MRLNKKDSETLSSWGFSIEDIEQIKTAIGKTTCKYKDKKISANKAVELLGRETFLSGISRSAFHWNCSRENNGNYVYFDSRKLFD